MDWFGFIIILYVSEKHGCQIFWTNFFKKIPDLIKCTIGLFPARIPELAEQSNDGFKVQLQ